MTATACSVAGGTRTSTDASKGLLDLDAEFHLLARARMRSYYAPIFFMYSNVVVGVGVGVGEPSLIRRLIPRDGSRIAHRPSFSIARRTHPAVCSQAVGGFVRAERST
ncbi:hypothetical protein RJ55_05269 [Drechmeria coniospora]|nr:hypothetical protein RJ55_05269 [Drechmeria coniospora]